MLTFACFLLNKLMLDTEYLLELVLKASMLVKVTIVTAESCGPAGLEQLLHRFHLEATSGCNTPIENTSKVWIMYV